MAIFGANNNIIYTDNASSEFRIAVNNVDSWRYNWSNGSIRQPYQPILCINSTLAGDTNPGQNYIHTWNTSAPGGYQGPASIVTTANNFTCPATGVYKANLTCLCRGGQNFWVDRNGSAQTNLAHYVYNTNYGSIGFSFILNCNAGDTLRFRGDSNGGNIWGSGWSIGTFERLG